MGKYLQNLGGVFLTPQRAGEGGIIMTEREELRRLIDVIEKASSSVKLDQAIEDINTFSNTASFLANKLDARLKSKDVAAKKPKSRMGKAIATAPMLKPRAPKPPQTTADSTASGMPSAVSSSTSQADARRLSSWRTSWA
jgi:hypothetical protein